MVSKRGMMQRIGIIILASIMVISYGNVTSIFAQASVKSGYVVIEESLREKFNENDFVEVIIKMKKQANLQEARENAINIAGAVNESKEKTKKRIGNYVVSALQDTMERTQKDLLDVLKTEKEKGNVKEFESFYIVNSVFASVNKKALKEILECPGVLTVIENKKISSDVPKKSSDIRLNSNEEEMAVPWNLTVINADKAQKAGFDGEGVVVGIIDSGVDYNHPAIKSAWRGNVPGDEIYSWKDYSGAGSKLPEDERGHGTHVAGTILGVEASGRVLGVAPKAKWIAVRAVNEDGEMDLKTLTAAGQWMLAPTDKNGVPHPEKKPNIINNSWAGNSSDGFFRDILQAWRAADILPVFSAGNVSAHNKGGEGSIGTPASYTEAFAVGALRQDMKIAKFSLRGPGPVRYSNNEIKPDVSAPGVNIRSAMPGGGYTLMDGTSMASPHVAGIAALLYQAKAGIKPDEVENVISESCRELVDEEYPTSPNMGYGAGIVNAYKAVKLVSGEGKAGFGTFKGRLLAKGKDLSVPEIKFTPAKTVYNTYDLTVDATVSDDNGVDKVNLKYKKVGDSEWISTPMEIIKGNKKQGDWEGTIPKTALQADKIIYKIEAEDVTKKTKATQDVEAVISSGIKQGATQNFEDNIDGYLFGGKTPMWQWGKANSGPKDTATGKLIGTNLDGDCSGLKDTTVLLPVIDLTDSSAPNSALTFRHWYDLDNYQFAFYDTAEVWIGVADGVKNPDEIDYGRAPVKSFKNSSRGWINEYIDLSAYKGKKIQVMLGVRAGEDCESKKDGWYIDDIAIEKASEEIPGTPVIKDFKYISGGRCTISFDKLQNHKITGYNMYRTSKKDADFKTEKNLFKKVATGKSSYLSDIPVPQEGEYFYCVTASIGDNEGEPSSMVSKKFTVGKKVDELFFDFESGEQGWTSVGEAGKKWDRGIPATDKDDLSPTEYQKKAKNPGENVWGTYIDHKVENQTKYVLESGAMDLSKLKKAKAYYQNWYKIDDDVDKGIISISNDAGGSWKQVLVLNKDTIDSSSDYPNPLEPVNIRYQGIWALDSFDIPSEYLTDKFKVKFEYDAGKAYGARGGWYIDDFAIYNAETTSIDGSYITNGLSGEAFSTAGMVPLGNPVVTSGGSGGDVEIPVYGSVTIKETEVTARSETGTGNYKIYHPAGQYKAIAEAKGYKPKEIDVTITKGGTEIKNIVLEHAGKGSLKFSVKDEADKNVADAKFKLINSDAVINETVPADGVISKELEAGKYILIISANSYKPVEKFVEIADSETNNLGVLKLSAFKAKDGEKTELKNDDGVPEAYLSTLDKNKISTASVKFNVSKESKLDKVKFMFATIETLPGIPGEESEGKKFKYSIYDKSNVDGLPGRLLAGPFEAKAGKDMKWTEITLPESVIVNGEFYVAYIQSEDKENAPMLAVDDTNKGLGHSFKMLNGAWKDPTETGSFMIRAEVIPVEKVNPSSGTTPGGSSGGISGGISPGGVLPPAGNDESKKEDKNDKDKKEKDMQGEEDKHPSKEYVDVLQSIWYRDAVDYVLKNKYFSGIGNRKFAPDAGMTRGMFVTVLSRMEKIDEAKYTETNFDDVKAGIWYAAAVDWAVKNKIVKGTGYKKFSPDSLISREEMAAIMYRYAEFKKIESVNKEKDESFLGKFADSNSVSSWAKNSLAWSVASGVIGGTDRGIEPQAMATRAQVAQIVKNYDEKVSNPNSKTLTHSK